MARTYGAIQNGITYSTGTVTLSDFGEVIYDHGDTTTTDGSSHGAAFIKCLKLIKDSMGSAGLSASIKIFVNGYNGNLIFPCLCWTMGGNEFLFAVYQFGAYAGNDQVLLAFRENSNTLTMRPTVPSAIDLYPYNTPVDNADCVYYLDTIRSDWYVRNFIFYDAFQSSQLASSFQVVYDDRGHVVILGKNSGNYSDNRDKTCFVFGKIGESNEFNDVVALNQPWIAVNGWTPFTWFSVPSISGGIDGTLVCALGCGIQTPNTATGVIAFPIYIIPPIGDSSGARPEVPLDALAIYADAMLATSNEPSVNFGTRFANGTWLCVKTYVNTTYNIQSAILIPWGGNSVPSVFD